MPSLLSINFQDGGLVQNRLHSLGASSERALNYRSYAKIYCSFCAGQMLHMRRFHKGETLLTLVFISRTYGSIGERLMTSGMPIKKTMCGKRTGVYDMSNNDALALQRQNPETNG